MLKSLTDILEIDERDSDKKESNTFMLDGDLAKSKNRILKHL
jgi:hypothetical protein